MEPPGRLCPKTSNTRVQRKLSGCLHVVRFVVVAEKSNHIAIGGHRPPTDAVELSTGSDRMDRSRCSDKQDVASDGATVAVRAIECCYSTVVAAPRVVHVSLCPTLFHLIQKSGG